MIKTTSLFAFLIVMTTLASCGQSSNITPTELTNTFKIEPNLKLIDYTNALELDINAPKGLAALLSLNKDEGTVAACTSFLIDKNIVITNSHCIPKALKNDKSLACGDYLHLVIKTDSNDIRTKCQKVIYFSQISDNSIKNNDYAVVRISDDISLSSYLSFDRSGFNENEKTSLLTLNYSQVNNTIISKFIEHRCTIKSSDTFGNINSLASSPLAGFKDPGTFAPCKVVHGNSGSPVVTNNHSVVGIVHAGYFPTDADLNQKDSITRDITSNLGIITNIRCQKFNVDYLDRDIPLSCDNENTSNSSSNLEDKKIEQKISEKVQEFTNNLIQSSSKVFLYNLKSKKLQDDKISISISPKCVLPVKDWLPTDRSKIIYSEHGKFTSNLYSYVLTIKPSFDYFGNLNINLNQEYDIQDFEISYLDKLDSLQMAFFKTTTSNGKVSESFIYPCN